MDILIVSDTHRVISDVVDLIRRRDFDIYVHLGDMVYDAEEIERITGERFIKIKGNNDFFDRDTPEEHILKVANYRIMLVHGHRQNVHYTKDQLVYLAKENLCDIIIYGHTHEYVNTKIDGIWVLNPGSTTNPRGGDFERGCIVLSIDGDKAEVERLIF